MARMKISDEAKKQGFYLRSEYGTEIWHTGRPDMSFRDAMEDLRNEEIVSVHAYSDDGTHVLRVSPLNFNKAAEVLKFYF